MADIGFIGLGQIGGAMSRNRIAAGHRLRVCDIDAGAVAAVVAERAEAAANPAEAPRAAGSTPWRGATAAAATAGPPASSTPSEPWPA